MKDCDSTHTHTHIYTSNTTRCISSAVSPKLRVKAQLFPFRNIAPLLMGVGKAEVGEAAVEM